MNKQIYTKKEVDEIISNYEFKLKIKEDIIQALLIEIKDLGKRK